MVRIIVDENANEAIKIAAENLASDLKKACNSVIEGVAEICIIEASELERSKVLTMAQKAELKLEKLKDIEKNPVWEAYLLQKIDDKLFITGNGRRGVIYGIYTFSEMAGVSPFYFWGDVQIKQKESLKLPENFLRFDHPQVKYRGIFINDEEELEAWCKKHTKDDTIGPEAYEKIFELLLRLKANYIWPAMHVNFFNENPENNALADRMGIVVGTSHCDMLLRSNQNEWKPWKEQAGHPEAVYDYSIEGDNREWIKEYWRGSVESNRDYDVCWTVGMRGIHDSGFNTKAIDQNVALTDEEKKSEKVKLLGQVIKDQRQILKEVMGEKKGSDALQLFVPYKEVLGLYDAGLEVPEDITLMWVNDNFGHVRRYPNLTEQKRSGGNGLYFHLSYWAHLGMSWLFYNSMPLNHVGNELKKCWQQGIRNIWIFNIGALKPLEIDLAYAMHYAWNAGRNATEIIDASYDREAVLDGDRFVAEFLMRTCGLSKSEANKAAKAYEDCMQLTQVCKLCHMQPGKFKVDRLGDEAFRRLVKLKEYSDVAEKVYGELAEADKAAFYQMFLMKMHASYLVNAAFYYGDRSLVERAAGNKHNAELCSDLSVKAEQAKRRLLYYYNHIMSCGKWEDILTPEDFRPPVMALHPDRVPLSENHDKDNYADGLMKPYCELLDNEKNCIALSADSFDRTLSTTEKLHIIRRLGRGFGDAVEAEKDAKAVYSFATQCEGTLTIELYRFLTLNSTAELKFVIDLDGVSKELVTPTNDEWRAGWEYAVMNNGEKLYMTFENVASGEHKLSVIFGEQYLTLTKVAVYPGEETGCKEYSNLGPVATDTVQDWYESKCLIEEDLHFDSAIYSEVPETIEPLQMIVVDKDYYKNHTIYMKNVVVPWPEKGRVSDCVYEKAGEISFSAALSLQGNEFATSKGFICIGSETEGRMGNAMKAMPMKLSDGTVVDNPWAVAYAVPRYPVEERPYLSFKINAGKSGKFYGWFLVKFDDNKSDEISIKINGRELSKEEYFGKKNMGEYALKQRWHYNCRALIELVEGENELVILADKPNIRIDRIYLSREYQLPEEIR